MIVLENDGRQRFTSHYIADRVARVADARAADLDGDGDLDVGVGRLRLRRWRDELAGEQGQLEVRAARAAAAVGGDQRDCPSISTATGVSTSSRSISQEWEEIWGFINDGRGGFTPRMLWGSTNPDFGSSWLSLADLDRDGDPDLLYANGDAFEYAPPNSRPWQGIQWLENRGNLMFEFHRIVDFQGGTSPEAADLDGDGDLDVLFVASNSDWDNPKSPSLVWLENDGKMRFTMHGIAHGADASADRGRRRPRRDGGPDAVTGGMHISRPYDRIGRITAWLSK